MNDEDLFHLALEKPIGERSAYLEEMCGADVARRRRVQGLLRSHETSDSFLEEPAAGLGLAVAGFDQDLTTAVRPRKA